ncbi:MAG: hypothetical protein J1F67_11595 [Muribaculaceae bacterium]|nr:hypothetical protein [Muribaculaceae bacterium]
MEQCQVDRFIQNFNLNMPRLFEHGNFDTVEFYEETAVLEYHLQKTIPMADFVDELDDQMDLILLYHVVPSHDIKLGHKCCAYTNPVFDQMVKINGQSNDNGEVDIVFVTLYDSLLTLGVELRNELNEMTSRFSVQYARSESDVLRDFIK